MKCVGILLFQLLITATGFWYVFHNPQKPAQIAEALRYASMGWVLLGWTCYSVVEVLATVRWQILFSDAVCAFAQLSSPPPSVIAQSVGPLHASRVVTALFSTRTDGSHVSARVSLRGNVSGRAFSGDRSDLSPGHVLLGVSFAIYPVSAEVTLPPPAVPWTSRWRSLARAIERHVRPLGCVPFPRAQTRLPESKEISLRVRRRAPVPLLVLPAYQNCFAPSYVFGRNEKCARLKCTWAANTIRSRERIGFILK
jgi:hypothetical protein